MTDIKVPEIYEFFKDEEGSLNTARTIILFGRNVSTYKFALCDTLMKFGARDDLKYADIREPFLKSLLSHYENNPKQFSGGENALTRSMDQYLKNEMSFTDLISNAEKVIYNNVFDAFQNIGRGKIDDSHILFEHDKKTKKLILTDNLNKILENPKQKDIIALENESRWRIVEEAWVNNLNPNLLEYSKDDGFFYSINKERRVNLRSAVDVLAPYQKDRCFYCNRVIDRNVDTQNDSFPDVDHFLPFSIIVRSKDIGFNPNGVWNLVVACKSCNRGSDGKFDAPPSNKYFLKLKKRNILYVEEHKHSLKNSILSSLDAKDKKGVSKKMDSLYKYFSHLKGWEPKEIYE